jgi:hypothetical protein
MKKEDETLIEEAQAMVVQNEQVQNASMQVGKIDVVLSDLQRQQEQNQSEIDELLAQAEQLIGDGSVFLEIDERNEFLVEVDDSIQSDVVVYREHIDMLDYVEVDDSSNWNEYFENVSQYAEKQGIGLSADPFKELMSDSQRIELEKRIKEDFTYKNAECDKYDYLIGASCGLIGGLIDMLFVGMPGSGNLTQFSDEMANSSVEQFAKLCGWKGASEGSDSTASAIGFLERNYRVNYDHRHGGDVGGRFKMSTKNHHIKSLAHSPDLVGLFFSILDQFTDSAHFVDRGKLISIDTKGSDFTLQGSNFVSKLFSGFVNWLAHLFSDMAGSSGASGRGSGIPIPFFSLFQFLNVGEFGQNRQTFATISVQVFEQGYDLRHGAAMAIPVVISELLARLTWTVKRHYYNEYPWSECMPSVNAAELRRTLLVAHGTLCLVDTADATLRSGGNVIGFMLRSNIVAWVRFGHLGLKEMKAWYFEGRIDIEVIDDYLDSELERLLAA